MGGMSVDLSVGARLVPRLLSVCAVLLLTLPTAPAVARWWQPAPSRHASWPLLPRHEVVHRFDPPATRWGAGHRGVDLAGHAGQPVNAALGGTVTFAAPLAGRGVVVVDHGGVRTTYEPVSARVGIGEVVDAGAVIGTLLRSQSHCFPRVCLHWGLLHGTTYLDPLSLVGAGPIRLLPLGGAPGRAAARWAGPTVWPVRPVGHLGGQRVRRGDGRAGRPGAAVPW